MNLTRTIDVIIVSYNTREMTLACLDRLTRDLGTLPDVYATVWVIDNASTDGSADAVEARFPAVRLTVNSKNVGFGAANNQTIGLANGQYVLLLNSDAFPEPNAIERMLAFSAENPDVAVQGPKLLNADGSLQRSCYPFPSPWRTICENLLLTAAFPNSRWFGDYRAWDHDSVRKVDLMIGACLLIRTDAFKRVGLFDEDFFLYYEETDLLKRMKDAGLRAVFNPGASVMHRAGASGETQSERTFNEFHRGRERFIRKHYGGVGLFIAQVMTVCGGMIRLCLYPVQALLSAGKRERAMRQWKLWWRLTRWALGLRGPGLQNAASPLLTPPFERARGRAKEHHT